MSMTWNSRGRRGFAGVFALATAAGPAAGEPPLPAVTGPALRVAETVHAEPERVRVGDVRIVPVAAGDRRLLMLAGAGRDVRAIPGVIIAARAAVPFGRLDRTASPVIVVDGRPVDSVVDRNDMRTVYAMVPAWAGDARSVTLQIGWLGDFERTLSNPVRLALVPAPQRIRR